MSALRPDYHSIVTAFRQGVLTIFLVLTTAFAAFGQNAARDAALDEAFARLAAPQGEGWRIAEADILREWSRSGSAAMDVLLRRGEQALDRGDIPAAIGHLTALTDHAPDFAAGWHTRAAAFALSGQVGPAISDLARTLELEPRHFAALTQLGALLEDIGDPKAAQAAYRESLRIHPHQQEAIDGLARLERGDQGTDI
ncbi:tetratricopeptide repeat protein [Paracoccus tibetensis]|nr:tetratricopeptide repeat protein [Paracoccus tibetensis]